MCNQEFHFFSFFEIRWVPKRKVATFLQSKLEWKLDLFFLRKIFFYVSLTSYCNFICVTLSKYLLEELLSERIPYLNSSCGILKKSIHANYPTGAASSTRGNLKSGSASYKIKFRSSSWVSSFSKDKIIS